MIGLALVYAAILVGLLALAIDGRIQHGSLRAWWNDGKEDD